MITGQNSEIRHEDVVFHIQTEDKGIENPCIVSLIYVGGQVLVAKRTSYADELASGLEEQGIAELMDRQHRTMIAAIRHGRFDEKVRSFLALKKGNGGAPVVLADGPPTLSTDRNGAQPDDSLVDMVGSFLGAEMPESLSLEVVCEGTPQLGALCEIRVRLLGVPTGRPVAGATVQVEFISPMREPELLAEARTEADGWVTIAFLVPPVEDMMAALVVTAVDEEIGRAEETILL